MSCHVKGRVLPCIEVLQNRHVMSNGLSYVDVLQNYSSCYVKCVVLCKCTAEPLVSCYVKCVVLCRCTVEPLMSCYVKCVVLYRCTAEPSGESGVKCTQPVSCHITSRVLTCVEVLQKHPVNKVYSVYVTSCDVTGVVLFRGAAESRT